MYNLDISFRSNHKSTLRERVLKLSSKSIPKASILTSMKDLI